MVNSPQDPGRAHAVISATVGTSHYVFTRVVRWLDSWLVEHPDVAGFVQHGHAPSPRASGVVESAAMVPRDRLLAWMRRSTVVVTHGGTGSMMDALGQGRKPVVVPRHASLGENVDDHQVAIARRLADMGWIHVCDTEAQLHGHLDRALTHRGEYLRIGRAADDPPPAAARLPRILGELAQTPVRRLYPRRLLEALALVRGRTPAGARTSGETYGGNRP